MPSAQLDIFSDSRDTMLRNDVVAALERRDAQGAQRALLALVNESPDDDALAPLRCLVDHLGQPSGGRIDTHAELLRACASLAEAVEPAAQRIFAARAPVWLVPSWGSLAQRAAGLRFESSMPEGHAAPLWLKARDWVAAENAVAGIESWRRIPAPLGWMAHARCRLAGVDAAWPLLAELAWLAPERFGSCARQLSDPLLGRWLARFESEFDGEGGPRDLEWFPAWSIVHEPLLGRPMGLAQAGAHGRAERTFRAVLGLLALERRGAHRELVEARRVFRDLHGGLYADYMRTR